jgi:glyoxylase-like metal-dependent hydrolase (beta-lactamase superfamily II)
MSAVVLTAFTCGWITLPMSFFLDGEAGQTKAPATVFLIDHPDGLALFDTGFGPRFERPVGSPEDGRIDLEADSNVGERLKAIGVDPAAIRWIINSHLHTDHAGGNKHLPNATVVVQDREWEYAFGEGERAYHKPEFDLGQPFLRVKGEHDLYGDESVVVFPTIGHTPGHQSARVRTATGEVVLAADCCNMKRSLDELRLPDHCFNAEQYMATLKTLREIRDKGTRVFYGHDAEFWKTVPQSIPLV